jgi:RimJ/RimL family protein N-acetyltransferase
VGWHRRVPRLANDEVTLREISPRDASALRRHIADPDVLAHVTPGPLSVEGLQQFARWAQHQRRRGALVCFAILAPGDSRPVGLMQLWPLDPAGATAEFGVLLGRAYWGTGVFPAAARLLFRFAFSVLQVRRLEARTTVMNGRANAALRKVGGRAEGRLVHGIQRNEERSDAFLWSILPEHCSGADGGVWPIRR